MLLLASRQTVSLHPYLQSRKRYDPERINAVRSCLLQPTQLPAESVLARNRRPARNSSRPMAPPMQTRRCSSGVPPTVKASEGIRLQIGSKVPSLRKRQALRGRLNGVSVRARRRLHR